MKSKALLQRAKHAIFPGGSASHGGEPLLPAGSSSSTEPLIRPATAADVAGIQTIFKYYVDDTLLTLRVDVPKAASLAELITACDQLGLPFLVAIDRSPDLASSPYTSSISPHGSPSASTTVSATGNATGNATGGGSSSSKKSKDAAAAAAAQGPVLGYCASTLYSPPDMTIATLNVYVERSAVGHGVGHALMRKAIEMLQAHPRISIIKTVLPCPDGGDGEAGAGAGAGDAVEEGKRKRRKMLECFERVGFSCERVGVGEGEKAGRRVDLVHMQMAFSVVDG